MHHGDDYGRIIVNLWSHIHLSSSTVQPLTRRLEKNSSGFSHVFSANLSYILSNTLIYIENFLHVCRVNKWFKTAENTDAKYIGNFPYII